MINCLQFTDFETNNYNRLSKFLTLLFAGKTPMEESKTLYSKWKGCI